MLADSRLEDSKVVDSGSDRRNYRRVSEPFRVPGRNLNGRIFAPDLANTGLVSPLSQCLSNMLHCHYRPPHHCTGESHYTRLTNRVAVGGWRKIAQKPQATHLGCSDTKR